MLSEDLQIFEIKRITFDEILYTFSKNMKHFVLSVYLYKFTYLLIYIVNYYYYWLSYVNFVAYKKSLEQPLLWKIKQRIYNI